jgi:flagellin-like hook-associated protein FlgL
MAVGPATGTGIHTVSQARAITGMRSTLDDLARQLATGQKADSFGTLGSARTLSLVLRERMSANEMHSANIDTLKPRLSLVATTVDRIQKIATDVRGSAEPGNYTIIDNGQTIAQREAYNNMSLALEALTADVNGRYLFGGRDADTKPVESMDTIMSGEGARAGFKTVVDERRRADLGADKLGRLTISPTANAVSLTDNGAVPGLRLDGLASGLSNATATLAGAPAVLDISLTGQPVAGETLTLTVELPDTTTTNITLTAATAPLPDPAPAGTFAIGANPAETAQNLAAALRSGIETVSAGAGVPAANVALPAASFTTTMAEDGSHPFGFDLKSVGSNLSGVTTTPLTGDPASFDVTFTGNPSAGQQLRIAVDLPDGTTSEIVLTAAAQPLPSPPAKGSFAIGATPAETATNFEAAMRKETARVADTALVTASAEAAANDFFNIDDNHPPMRVGGTPETATALVSGTPANTVFWYKGEGGSDPARHTSTARIDTSVSVSYGVRANEAGIRDTIKQMAVMSSMTFSESDPNGSARYTELTNRVRGSLDNQGDIQGIQVDLAVANRSIVSAESRHRTTAATLEAMQFDAEGVSKEEVAVRIFDLQTRLSASYETTSIMARLSLVNFM